MLEVKQKGKTVLQRCSRQNKSGKRFCKNVGGKTKGENGFVSLQKTSLIKQRFRIWSKNSVFWDYGIDLNTQNSYFRKTVKILSVHRSNSADLVG